MKRIGVFFFCDTSKVVDSYVEYYLKQLKKVCDYLLVVINGTANNDGLTILAENSDGVISRENKGFDAWAYKEAIEYIGWDEIEKADELLLTNLTVFGTVTPIEEMFERAEKIECDYWGLTRIYENEEITSFMGLDYPGGFREDSVMSNFWVIRPQLLHSPVFRQYWDEMPPITSYAGSVILHEASFTYKMKEAGFVFATLDNGNQRGNSPSTSVYDAYDLAVNDNIPIIRKKAFYDANGDCRRYGFDSPRKVMDYVSDCTDFDEGMIWESLLRTTSLYDLNRWLNFSRIIHDDRIDRQPTGELRYAVIQHIFNVENLGYCMKYLTNFPKATTIKFVTKDEENIPIIQDSAKKLIGMDISFESVPEAKNEALALMYGARDIVLSGEYDLICTLSDVPAETYNYTNETRQFMDSGYENIVGNENIIANITAMFEKEKRLGLVIPPIPHTGKDFYEATGGWKTSSCMNGTKKMMQKLEIKTPVDFFKPVPAPLGRCFWFRCSALLPMFEYVWGEREITEKLLDSFNRLYPIVAQSCGFYPALVRNEKYALFALNEFESNCTDYSVLLNQLVPGCRYAVSAEAQIKKARANMVTGKPKGSFIDGEKLKNAAKIILPIGIWNAMRKVKCRKVNEPFVDELNGFRMPLKAVKWICPRFLWEFAKSKLR